MKRLTTKENGRYSAPDMDGAIKRLGAYEDILEALEREQESIAARMAELKTAGKEKTVQYRELFVKKLQNLYALGLFQGGEDPR